MKKFTINDERLYLLYEIIWFCYRINCSRATHRLDLNFYPLNLCTKGTKKIRRKIKKICISSFPEEIGYALKFVMKAKTRFSERKSTFQSFFRTKIDFSSIFHENPCYVRLCHFLEQKCMISK